MNFHILTLFPEMIMGGLSTSITGRAMEAGHITIEAINIRDFSKDKHKKVDDYPYGGGAGMLMQAQPVFDAYQSVAEKIPVTKKKRVIYVTPQGYTFNQRMAENFAKCDELIFLCGHYEGIDERVLEEVVTDYVSIGDYVLTGGELASMVMIDAIARLVPGVLHNDSSAVTESFHGDLLEHPHYSRPEVWHEKSVPEVLLSGNQKKIDAWRVEASVQRTKERRPDLYQKYVALQNVKERLMKQKLLHIDMIEHINRGRALLIAESDDYILLQDKDTGVYYYTGENASALKDVVESKGLSIEKLVLHQAEQLEEVQKWLPNKKSMICYQSVYTNRERMSVSGLYRADGQPTEDGLTIRPLTVAHFDVLKETYEFILNAEESEHYGANYVRERIRVGALFGAFLDGELAGYMGVHDDGSLGLLHVLKQYRGRRLAKALMTYMINMQLEQGCIPYGQVETDNTVSCSLQKSLGLHLSKTAIAWLW